LGDLGDVGEFGDFGDLDMDLDGEWLYCDFDLIGAFDIDLKEDLEF
jgi:hypothetical protein